VEYEFYAIAIVCLFLCLIYLFRKLNKEKNDEEKKNNKHSKKEKKNG